MGVVFVCRGAGKTGKNDALPIPWRVRVAMSRSQSEQHIRKTTKCFETGNTRFSPVIVSNLQSICPYAWALGLPNFIDNTVTQVRVSPRALEYGNSCIRQIAGCNESNCRKNEVRRLSSWYIETRTYTPYTPTLSSKHRIRPARTNYSSAKPSCFPRPLTCRRTTSPTSSLFPA